MGKTVAADPDYVRLLSYVVLFSPDFLEVKEASPSTAEAMAEVTETALVAVSPSQSASGEEDCPKSEQTPRQTVEAAQDTMVTMLRRLVFARHPRRVAVTIFADLLACIADLRELTAIKRKRSLAKPVTQPGGGAC